MSTTTLALNVDPTGVERGANRVDKAFDKTQREAVQTEKAFDKVGVSSGILNNKLKLLAAGGFGLLVASVTKGIASFRPYNAALTEVSTLINGTAQEMSYLDKKAKELSGTFGGGATAQAKAFYQAISAGVGSVHNASKFLEQANKLAIGGVTDITTAVDGLTTATNAYKSAGLTASSASDILFTGVKAGKTTVAELSNVLGQVVPIASGLGVQFDEVVASVAALTTVGQSTSQAVTGIRGALSGVLKPTSEAAKLANALGLEFNSASLKAKGLGGFLDDVKEKTGGSKDAMSILFGSVEALNAVLALTSDAGDSFKATMQEMGLATGATDEAFNKVSDSLEHRFGLQMNKAKGLMTAAGGVAFSILVPALEMATGFVESFASELGFLVVAIGSIAFGKAAVLAGAYGAAMLSGASMVGIMTTAVSGLSAALTFLAGPAGIIALAIAATYLFRDSQKAAEEAAGKFEAANDKVSDSLTEVINLNNLSIGQSPSVQASNLAKAKSAQELAKQNYAAAKSALALMEAERGKALSQVQVYGAGSLKDGSTLGGFENSFKTSLDSLGGMIKEKLAALDKMESGIKNADATIKNFAQTEIPTGPLGITVSGRKNNSAGSDTNERLAEVQNILASLGEGGAGKGKKAKKGRKAKADNSAQKAAQKAARAVGMLKSSYDQLKSSIDPAYAAQLQLTQGISTVDAATRAGIITDEEALSVKEKLREKFDIIGRSYSDLKDKLDPLRATTRQYEADIKTVNDALAAGIIQSAEAQLSIDELRKKHEEVTGAATRSGGAFKDMFKSIITGADKSSAAVSKLLEKFADNFFESGFSALSQGFGSPGGGGIINKALDFLFNANGNAFGNGQVMAFANGAAFTDSIVDTPTSFNYGKGKRGVMGEAGPEAVMPLKRGAGGKLGVESTPQSVHVTVSVSASDDLVAVAEAAGTRATVEIVDQRDRQNMQAQRRR